MRYTLRRGAVGALAATALTVLAVATPMAAHAEMTDPPACTESPFGGCLNGPVGNGSGGGGWGPWSPGGTLDAYSTGTAIETGWLFRRLDGEQATPLDAENIRAVHQLGYCIPYGSEIVCS